MIVEGFYDRLGRKIPATIRGVAGGSLTVDGKRVHMLVYSGGPLTLDPKEYPLPVVVDIAGLTIKAQNLPTPFNHDINDRAGETESIVKTDNHEIEATAVLDITNDCGRMIAAANKGGFDWEASIGASVQEMEEYGPGEMVTVNGKTFRGPLLVARKATLEEISYVRRGADVGRTSVRIAARKGKKKKAMEFDTWVASLGLDPANIAVANLPALRASFAKVTAAEGDPPADKDDEKLFAEWITAQGGDPEALPEKMKATLRAAYDAEMAGEDEEEEEEEEEDDELPNNPVKARGVRKAIRAAASKEFRKMYDVMQIEQACGKEHADIRAKAIGKNGLNWDLQRVKDEIELKELRARHASGPWIATSGHDQVATLDAVTGAMILRAGGKLDSKHYGGMAAVAMGLPMFLRAGLNTDHRQRAMEYAHRLGQLSLIDLCREAIRLDGRDVPLGRSDTIRAAFSGGALTNIFTTSINAIILDTYLEAPDTTGGWTMEGEVNDFKTNDEIQLVKDGTGMKKHPRGGTAPHSARSDRVESYRIERFSEQSQVDEQDVIDDTYDAIKDFPVEMGKKAARLRPDLVYGIILANPTLNATSRELFNTTDGNLGSSAALSSASLKAAISAMMLIQDNGVNLNLAPTHLIVPPSLKFTAAELLHSAQIVIAGTAGAVTERGSKNVLENEIGTIVADARLENGVTNPKNETAYGGSATTWYLASIMARTIRVAYLKGTGKAPQTRTFTLDRGQWGIGWDVNMDIGGAPLDWRGLRKTTA